MSGWTVHSRLRAKISFSRLVLITEEEGMVNRNMLNLIFMLPRGRLLWLDALCVWVVCPLELYNELIGNLWSYVKGHCDLSVSFL